MEENLDTTIEGTIEELDEQDIDAVADSAIAILENILPYFNIKNSEIAEYEGEQRELILDITGEDLAILIGRHGKTLGALQSLVSATTLYSTGIQYPLTIDVESYKVRQKQKIEEIAERASQKALRYKKPISLKPMSPYERRLVHMYFREKNNISTYSKGEGINRHIVIHPEV